MRTALCLLMALLLGLAGCGGDSGPGPTASAGGGAAPPPPPGGAPPPDSPPPDASGQPPAESTPPDAGPMPGQEGGLPPPGSPDSPPGGEGGTPAPETPPDQPPEGSPEGLAAPRVARVKTLQELADDALHAGNEQEWFRLTYTNYIVNPRSWPNLDKQMAWVPALRRPALGARFGIAAVYVNPPKDFEGSPQPIGSTELKTAMDSLQKKGAENSGGGGEAPRRGKKGKASEEPAAGVESPGGESPGGGDTAKPGQADLQFHTGELGTKFAAALQARIDSGAYGNTLKDMVATQKRGARRSADPNDPSAGGEPNLPGSTDEGGSGRAENAPAKSADAGTRLGTALVWLGKVSNKDDLASLAQKANLDVLVIYELALKTNTKTTLVNNVTKMRIVNVATLAKKDSKEPDLFESAPLENRMVLIAREKGGKSIDSVEKEVAHAIEALDKGLKPVALPAGVTGEAIKRRLAAQIAERPADPLPLAVEIRYYAVKGLLTPSEASNGTAALLGPAEYAQLIASAPTEPGLEQQVGQALGRAMSIDGVLGLLGAANSATGQSARDNARERSAAGKAKNAPAASGGLQGLFPFGSGGGAKK